MAIQTPIANPSANGGPAWAPVSSVTVPLPGLPAAGASPLSELPALPPPPFINYSNGAVPPTPPPPAARTAQSVPISGPSAEIPPPHMAAPWVFLQMPKPALAPPMPVQATQPPPPQPVQAPPQQSNQTPPPAQQQPEQQPQSEKPPEPPKLQDKGPDEPIDLSPLNNKVIKSLNERLNSESEETRGSAAIDLFNILDKNPGVADDPKYKPYVDAFMERIIKDPSPIVRAGGELSLHLGKVKSPPQAVMSELETLSKKRGKFDFESDTVSSILENLNGANAYREDPKKGASGSVPGPTPQLPPGVQQAQQTAPVQGNKLNLVSSRQQAQSVTTPPAAGPGQRLNMREGAK